MTSFLIWWAAAELLAFAALPLALRLLRALPDRGYAAAKPLGLLLAAFCFWFAASLGLISTDRGSVLLVTFAIVLLGLIVAALERHELAEFFRANVPYVVTVEAIFLAVFGWFALLRAYAPDIAATEKPFELAFLNGVTRTPYFPPPDPWLSGHVMNYYYFGWINVDFLDRLTQTSNSIGFNLGTPLTAALAAVACFGLVYALVRALSHRVSFRGAVCFGLLAVLLLLFASNLEGLFELMAAHHLGSSGFYNAIGVGGLTPDKSTSTWYPKEFWFWWRATRMGSGFNIMEFPYFSFMLADLHPHVMVMPFALLSLTFSFNLLAGDEPLDGNWWRIRPLCLVVLAILLGSLGVLNAWDQPTAFLVLLLVALFSNRRRLGSLGWPALRASAFFILPLLVLAFLLYLPYWAVFEKTDIVGVSAIMLSTMAPNEARASMATPPLHLLLFWGPLLWLMLSFLLVHMRHTRALSLPVRYTLWPLLLSCLPLILWAMAVAGHAGLAGLADEIRARGSGLLTELILLLFLFLNLAALMREALPLGEGEGKGPGVRVALLFALVCSAVALLWIMSAELFYVVESSLALRYNTVFKLWFQAWLLGSAAVAVGNAYVLNDWRLPSVLKRPNRLAWSAATVALLLASLVYPVIATPNRTDGFAGHPTLDGLAYVRRDRPADFAAAAWLSANVRGTPVIVEAEGGTLAGNFSGEGARISELTGLPTVLGWLGHEQIHHGILAPLQTRSDDIKNLYTTSDPIVAHSLLQHYGVQFVIVGDLERRVYGDAGLLKFPQMGAAVYRAPGMTIYDVTQQPAAALAPPNP